MSNKVDGSDVKGIEWHNPERPRIDIPDVVVNLEDEGIETAMKNDDKGLGAKQRLLEDAIATVANRGEAYDGAEDNFTRIARYWTVHMKNAYGLDIIFTPTDVALMMSLMKHARLDYNPTHRDSYVDVAGYAACGADIAETMK